MKYLYGLRLSSNEASIFKYKRICELRLRNFRSERTKKGLERMVPTFSPTEVAAEPTYAKLRQTDETPELREARDFFC